MTLTPKEIKRAALIYLAVTLALLGAAALAGGPQQVVSALMGSLLLAASAGILVWIIMRAMVKKSFALAGIVIVIKYLLLAGALYWICTQSWVSLVWLAAGVGSAVFATALYGLSLSPTEAA